MYILTAAQNYQAALEATQLGHGYLTYALVEEGLKSGVVDKSPKDGLVTAQEWLDYATERVPQMQLEKSGQQQSVQNQSASANVSQATSTQDGARQLVQDKPIEGDKKVAASEREVQRPRVFYRREVDARAFIVARP